MTSDLRTQIKGIPLKPGVYLFRDEQDKVLYVGKAKILRTRVGSYFTSKHIDRPWIAVMIGLVNNIETIVVNNELEALILEATLITEYQPKFNIKLTDDKAYPYIKLTINELFPRFQIVRKRTRDGAKYFGPFLSAWSARLTCEFLRRIYGVHISSKPLVSTNDRPCLNCQLEGNRCPLANEISEEQYASSVKSSVNFLLGKRRSLIKDIERRMKEASDKKSFELAAKLRNQLRAVRHTTATQEITSSSDEDFDVIAAVKSNISSVVTRMSFRSGNLNGQQHFNFEITADQGITEVIRQFIINFYHNFHYVPPLVVLAEDISDRKLIESWLANTFGHRIELRVAVRGEKLDFVSLAKKNAQARLETILSKSGSDLTSLIALKELLNLSDLPTRIEAVDISNLGPSEPVGATVCFINGQPDKNEYRRYRIRTVKGQNDFAMIGEVTARRFADTSRPLPDLFVVDGGPEQLKAALTGLEKAGHEPNVIVSLAKKPDRIFLPGKKKPVAGTRGNKGILLLARIRDDVHRFGISFQRHRQSRKSLGKLDKG